MTNFLEGDNMTLDMPFMFNKRLKIRLDISIKEVERVAKITNKKAAEKKAAEFYNVHFDMNDAIFKGNFATNLNAVLQKLGIRAVIGSLKEYENLTGRTGASGFLLKNGDEYAIFVEEDDPMERKRFTIAHEIGHKVLNHINNAEYVSISFRDNFSSQWTKDEEIAANAFAAVLLMPEKIIRHVYTLTSDIPMTARYLGVSDSAVRKRLDSLGIL